jgi:hypothetical protein
VVNDGSKNYDNKNTIMGYKGAFQTVICTSSTPLNLRVYIIKKLVNYGNAYKILISTPSKIGTDRRQEILDGIAAKNTFLPNGVLEDMDQTLLDFINQTKP